MTETIQHEGGCLCGAVRYTVAGEPQMVGVCHCRHCQRQSGSAFSMVWGVADGQFSQSGETRLFADVGDSGLAVERRFCGNCGSPITSVMAAMPGMVFVKAGTLDAPGAGPAPQLEVYRETALPWCNALPGALQFARGN